MRLVVILLLATVTACSTPPRSSESQASTGDRTTAPSANSPTAAPPPPSALIVAPPADPRAERRTHDLAVDAWGEPHDLASHMAFLRTLDAATDASCRSTEIRGDTVAAQVEAFQPGAGVTREAGCSGTRCRVRIMSVGERRVVGLEIFYTRRADGKAVEVDCYPMRGG